MVQGTGNGHREEKLPGTDGVGIFIRSWRPAEKARAVVVIVHGFNSHSGQYAWVADQFVQSALAVYAPDLRGRGRSDGERFFVEKFADYVADVTMAVSLAKSREPGLPVFLLGHSAGGVVSCGYALEHQDELAGLICESFAFQVPAPPLALTALKGLSRFAPHLPVLRLRNRDFSRDLRAVQALNADPLIADETQPALTVAEMVRADDRLKREFARLTLPVLILHGTADKATKPSGSQFFYARAGSKDKTLKLYRGHAHDLLNDLEKRKVMTDIKNWIDARLPRETAIAR